MQTFSVRRLSTSGQGQAARSSYIGFQGTGAFMALSDRAGAVYDIKAEELTLTHDEIVARFEARRLAANDLVQVDGRWCSFIDSMPFGEIAAKHDRGAVFKRVWPYVAIGFGVIALMLFYVMGRALGR